MDFYLPLICLNIVSILIAVIIYSGARLLKDKTSAGVWFLRAMLADIAGCIVSLVTYIISYTYNIDYEVIHIRYEAVIWPYYIGCLALFLVDVAYVEFTHMMIVYMGHLSGLLSDNDEKTNKLNRFILATKVLTYVFIGISYIADVIIRNNTVYTIAQILFMVCLFVLYYIFARVLINVRKSLDKVKKTAFEIYAVFYIASILFYCISGYTVTFPVLTTLLLALFILVQVENVSMSSVEAVQNALSQAEDLNIILNEQYLIQQQAYESLLMETEKLNQIADIFSSFHELNMAESTFRICGNQPEAIGDTLAQWEGEIVNLQELINKMYSVAVSDSNIEEMLQFANLSTLNDRMKGLKSIHADTVNKEGQWRRFFFIRPDNNTDDDLSFVFHVVLDINSDRQSLEQFKYMSYKDALTGGNNRNAYILNADELDAVALPDDLYVMEADVNGLKKANDTLGHEAGDELITGTWACLNDAIKAFGDVYRVGGDEFVCIFKAQDDAYDGIMQMIYNNMSIWKGKYTDRLSFSIGCVKAKQFPGLSIMELAKEADKRMYNDKQEFYKKNPSCDRRKM